MESVLAALAATRVAAASSTADRVAGAIREQIAAGRLAPGARLPEQAFAEALKVSRNTIRESFGQLVSERILVREQHRGVFVAIPGPGDVRDVYRARRLIEPAAIRSGDLAGDPAATARVAAAVARGRGAAAAGDWSAVADANQEFHRAVVALAGSARLDRQMDLLLAEMRLIFHRMGAVREFHEPYLHENTRIADRLTAGRRAEAADELAAYLAAAENQIAARLPVDKLAGQ
ncbi:GntR family transcriptional regulator [Actinoplanes ianthinogenes]|uniref:GntR family transcriptional regulator n=1 Tax=Actinoplanes ianthinogenes TaxID=122358 RepID=A0ABN6CT48_9ACTN|nr:GntR family transcriptional regulator [Actinoplanes ianthinogenes]BCJ48396.1 GntR family transcriptional regulator [Actinoplanes ianthinogenes]GGR46671.1 GntR family transcriptional regulator [Actinoplanes ianthinogenes]